MLYLSFTPFLLYKWGGNQEFLELYLACSEGGLASESWLASVTSKKASRRKASEGAITVREFVCAVLGKENMKFSS
jgi:hypothetical protein